jgi:CheY-like chemotaxis protein
VRHLVELHGGEVAAESEGKGKGSTFTLRLPVRPRAGVQEPSRPAVPVRVVEKRAAGASSLSGVRVLIAEDEEDARAMLKALLQGMGASVEAVGTAAEAWVALEGAGCDVLLSDIGMPGEDGYSLVARVRGHASARVSETRAVALTAYARAEDRERSLAAGFDAFLPKPVEPAELLAVIHNLVSRPRALKVNDVGDD